MSDVDALIVSIQQLDDEFEVLMSRALHRARLCSLPVEAAYVPVLVKTGKTGVKTHKIVDFPGIPKSNQDTVACKCGWHYREHSQDYAVQAMKDHLLDKYNDHRVSLRQQGRDEDQA